MTIYRKPQQDSIVRDQVELCVWSKRKICFLLPSKLSFYEEKLIFFSCRSLRFTLSLLRSQVWSSSVALYSLCVVSVYDKKEKVNVLINVCILILKSINDFWKLVLKSCSSEKVGKVTILRVLWRVEEKKNKKLKNDWNRENQRQWKFSIWRKW